MKNVEKGTNMLAAERQQEKMKRWNGDDGGKRREKESPSIGEDESLRRINPEAFAAGLTLCICSQKNSSAQVTAV